MNAIEQAIEAMEWMLSDYEHLNGVYHPLAANWARRVSAVREAITALQSMQGGAVRCEYCDGTGDVHSPDGEWRGECTECTPPQIPAVVEAVKELDTVSNRNYELRMENAELKSKLQGGAVWSGWACQYPGKMPRLYGNKKIAELNYYPKEGDKLMFLSAQVAATEISGTPAIYGLRNVVSRAWDGKTTVPADRADEYDADALVPLYTHPQSSKGE